MIEFVYEIEHIIKNSKLSEERRLQANNAAAKSHCGDGRAEFPERQRQPSDRRARKRPASASLHSSRALQSVGLSLGGTKFFNLMKPLFCVY